MKFIKTTYAALTLIVSTLSTTIIATAENRIYANTRGWEVRQDDQIGCTATHPEMGDVLWDILVSPAGNWEIRIEDLAGLPNNTEFLANIIIDNNEIFQETYFTHEGSFIGVLPLNQRLALAKGSSVNFDFNNSNYVYALNGSTAAMLKLEECWHDFTGYDANVSSKRGSYAFK